MMNMNMLRLLLLLLLLLRAKWTGAHRRRREQLLLVGTRRDEGAQETDRSCTAVNVENGPQGQRDVDVHKQSGVSSVAHHRNLSIVAQMEFNLITENRSLSHVL